MVKYVIISLVTLFSYGQELQLAKSIDQFNRLETNSPKCGFDDKKKKHESVICTKDPNEKEKSFYVFECTEKDKRKCHSSIKDENKGIESLFLVFGLGNDDAMMAPIFLPAALAFEGEDISLFGNDEGVSHTLNLELELNSKSGMKYDVAFVSGLVTTDLSPKTLLYGSAPDSYSHEKYEEAVRLLLEENPHIKRVPAAKDGEYDRFIDGDLNLMPNDIFAKYFNLPDDYNEKLISMYVGDEEAKKRVISFTEKSNIFASVSSQPKGKLLYFKAGGSVFQLNENKRSKFGAASQQRGWHKLWKKADMIQYDYDAFKGSTSYGAGIHLGLGIQKIIKIGDKCSLESNIEVDSYVATDNEKQLRLRAQSSLETKRVGLAVRTGLSNTYGASAGGDLSYKINRAKIIFSMDRRPDDLKYTGFLTSDSKTTMNDFYYKFVLRVPLTGKKKK